MSHASTKQFPLIVTTAFGLESIASRELKELGYENISTENGYLTVQAELIDICKTNLWLRSAERVYVELASFPCEDFGTLFDCIASIPWENWIPRAAELPVLARSVRSQLTSTPHIQAIVKKAIVTRLLKHYGGSHFPEAGPMYRVECVLQQNKMRILLDTSGEGLHKRGYRQQTGSAPLRETLAASLVLLSYWEPGRLLVDPFCGTGTILIEAAMIGRNIAPGMYRSFASDRWPNFTPEMWPHTRKAAKEKVVDHPPFGMQGYDIDNRVISNARSNARLAGVENDIHFQLRDVRGLSTKQKYGCLITNPPWGERLEDEEHAAELTDILGEKTQSWETWSFYILSALPDFEHVFGYQADRRRKLYHARIECTYYQYPGPRPPLFYNENNESASTSVTSPNASDSHNEVETKPVDQSTLFPEDSSESL